MSREAIDSSVTRPEPSHLEGRAGHAFVGRGRELGELASGLEEARSGHGGLFLLSGEPGIGKSRVADEFTAGAQEQGARVLRGRCWEGGGAPAYWPWVQAIRSLLRGADPEVVRDQLGGGAPDVAQMLPELHELFPELPSPPSTDPESARFRLFDSTASFLVKAAGAQPLVVVLDDLHAADTPSLLFLRFVAGVLAESHILVVGTFRDVELSPEHPLTKVVAELGREPTTRELPLRGLKEGVVAAFVRTTAGVEPHPLLVSALHRETRGNPLFLGEAVRLLAAEGRLGEMAAADLLRVAIPSRIRDVITRRVGRLGEASRRALEIASVLGPELSLEGLRRVGEIAAEDLLDALGELLREYLLTEVPGALGRFRFSHELVRETLYESLTPAVRVRLHRRAAEVLEDLYGQVGDSHLAELAHHFFEAARGGDAGKAVNYSRLGGDQAVRALAYEEAARLYRMALSALELEPTLDEELQSDLLLALGEAQARAGDAGSARETFLRASEVTRRTGAASQLARVALGYGGRFVWLRAGSDPHIVPLLQDALAMLGEDDDQLRVRLLARLACALRSSRDRERSDKLSEQAVDMARRLGDPATLCYALEGRIAAIWWPENPEERLALSMELVALADEADELERAVAGRVMRTGILFELGATAEARADVDATARGAERLRQPSQRWIAGSIRLLVELTEGRFDLADAIIREAFDLADPARDEMSDIRSQLFLLRRHQGRLVEIEDLVRSAVDEFPWYPLHRAALACLLIDLGRLQEGRAVFGELAREDFRALYRDNEWLFGMSLASDACFMLGDSSAAGTLYQQLFPFAGRHAVGWAAGSLGAVDRYLGLLSATLGRLEDAEGHLEDAIRLNDRMGARPWSAHCRHDLAKLLLARDAPGDRERAGDLLHQALSTARGIGLVALEARIKPLLGDAPAAAPPQAVPAQRGVFRREGEYFSIAYRGDAFRLKDTKGLRYLAHLLANPGREVHVLDLVLVVEGAPDPREASKVGSTEVGLDARGLGDAGAALDPQARAAYKRRLEELRQDVEEAESFGDRERAVRAQEEMDFLARELAAAVGLGGRDRRAASAAERARQSVTKAIKSAVDRIAEHSPALGRYLGSTVRTGTFCASRPDSGDPISWDISR